MVGKGETKIFLINLKKYELKSFAHKILQQMSRPCSQFVAPSSFSTFNSPLPCEIFVISFHWPFWGDRTLWSIRNFIFLIHFTTFRSLLNVLTFNIWLVPFLYLLHDIAAICSIDFWYAPSYKQFVAWFSSLY